MFCLMHERAFLQNVLEARISKLFLSCASSDRRTWELAYIFIGTSKMIASDSLLFAMNILRSIHDELLLVELFAKWQETCIYFLEA